MQWLFNLTSVSPPDMRLSWKYYAYVRFNFLTLFTRWATFRITAYLRLVVLAVGFQHAAKSGLSRDSEVLIRSIDAARSVIQITVERLYPTGHLRYAMEANFVYVSFAAAYLVNVRAPYLHLLLFWWFLYFSFWEPNFCRFCHKKFKRKLYTASIDSSKYWRPTKWPWMNATPLLYTLVS